jgi:hypothetical protein
MKMSAELPVTCSTQPHRVMHAHRCSPAKQLKSDPWVRVQYMSHNLSTGQMKEKVHGQNRKDKPQRLRSGVPPPSTMLQSIAEAAWKQLLV